MASVSATTELVYVPRKCFVKRKSDYDVDFWREIKKRWMVFGVLLSLLAAVTAPRAGAPGGSLKTEYLRFIPLWYIYYTAGRRSRAAPRRPARARLVLLTVVHAHVVVPALCVMTVEAFGGSGIDPRIVRGAVLWGCGGGCGWLSAAVWAAPPAPLLAGVSWAAALVTQPLYMFIMCGRITIPHFGSIIATVLSTLTPYLLGAWLDWSSAGAGRAEVAVRVSALCLLYAECCGRLREAEGSLYIGDVMVTLLLVMCWVTSSVCWSVALSRCGALGADEARALAAAAVPKCLDVGWETSASCIPTGLSHLPAVFIAPAQALLLAAYICDTDADADVDVDETLTIVSDGK